MSMHAIEDLVEDSVRMIDRSEHFSLLEKRQLLFNLYAIQELFDTSYTHFRVIDILLKHRFVYKIPVAAHPELDIAPEKLPAPGQSQWIYGEDENAGPVAYGENGNGTVYLYTDAGDPLWQRLCELKIISGEDCLPPEKLTVPQLTNEIVTEAERQQDSTLLQQWYNLLVNGVLESDFAMAEGIPGTLPGLLADDSLAALRNMAQRNNIGTQKKRRDEDDYLGWPGLQSELPLAKNLEETYRIHYFLDLKKTPDQLKRSYHKDQKSLQETPQKISLIPQLLQPFLDAKGWMYADTGKENHWLWYKDIPDEQFNGPGHRFFILLQLDFEEKTLFCKQAVQHSLVLHWQKRQPGLLPHEWHFFTDIISWLPEAWTSKNKHLGKWGHWIFDAKQSEKIISGHIEDLIAGLEKLDNTYFDFVLHEFPEKFFGHDPDRLLYLLEEGEDGTGIIPRYVLFDSKFIILIAFAAWHFERGDKKNATALVEKINDLAQAERISAKQKEIVLQPFLEHWELKKEIHFPPVWHSYLFRHLSS